MDSMLGPILRRMQSLVTRETKQETELMWESPTRHGNGFLCKLTRRPVPNADAIRSMDDAENEYVVIETGETSDSRSVTTRSSQSTDSSAGFPMLGEDRPASHEMVSIKLDMRYDNIHIKEMVGFGAFGQVFSAEMNGKEVAIKMLPPHLDDLPDVKESLRKELTLLARVGHHSNVVKCLGGSVVGPHLFIVSELKKGGTLGNLIHKGGPNRTPQRLPVRRALQIVVDILQGLDHLHNLTPMVVHRDLKPDNVLLDEEDRACVADFGLSRSKSASYVDTENTNAGTTPYLAPEVMEGKLNEKIDIYAVGMILWECLTAIRPWGDFDQRAILFIVHQGNRPEFPPEIFDESVLMGEVRQLIVRCWEGKPEKRPSCKQLLEDVQRLRGCCKSQLG